MTGPQLNADALIDLVIETLKGEISPDLPADKRYTVAMMTSALEIARREIALEPESAQWELLDPIYDDGEGSMRQLALDLRSGKVDGGDDATELRSGLRKLLIAELRVRNPGFLKSRGVKG